MTIRRSITDPEENLRFNKDRWGNKENWSATDNFGYQWGGGYEQKLYQTARFADKFLKPYTGNRYDLKILELSPGGGRFTAELIRYAETLDLLDMNEACLDICRERFKFVPTPIRYYLNDGRSCEMIEDQDYDLIASFDSMVHVHPDIVNGYVLQLATKLKPGCLIWMDHSGKGAVETGHRTDMTMELMAEFAKQAQLEVVAQVLRNERDCISVLKRANESS